MNFSCWEVKNFSLVLGAKMASNGLENTVTFRGLPYPGVPRLFCAINHYFLPGKDSSSTRTRTTKSSQNYLRFLHCFAFSICTLSTCPCSCSAERTTWPSLHPAIDGAPQSARPQLQLQDGRYRPPPSAWRAWMRHLPSRPKRSSRWVRTVVGGTVLDFTRPKELPMGLDGMDLNIYTKMKLMSNIALQPRGRLVVAFGGLFRCSAVPAPDL